MFRNGPNIFLDSHKSRKQKNGVKNAWKFFLRFSQISGAKKWREKNALNFFLRFSRIWGAKEWREKTREIFQDSHEYREQKNGGKKTREKFFIITKMSRAKKWILRNAPKIFLDSHECREQKNGVKKTREIFF